MEAECDSQMKMSGPRWPAPDRGEKLRRVFPTTAEVTKLCYNKYFQQIAPLLSSLSSQADDAPVQLDILRKKSFHNDFQREMQN